MIRVGGLARAALAVAALAAFAACDQRTNSIAQVGRHRVELEAFQAYVTAVTGERWQAASDRVAERLLDQFLDQEVVAAAVRVDRDLRIPTEPGARSALIRSLLEQMCGTVPPLPDEAVEQEVATRMTVSRPPRVRARQILVDERAVAEDGRRQMEAGADWDELSQRISRAPNAATGGDLGVVEEGRLPPELEAGIFALGEGEISAPVQSPAGYHLFQVLEVHPGGAQRRDEVVGQVRRELAPQWSRRYLRQCIDRLALEVGVEVHRQHLWFSYDGRYVEEPDGKQ